MRKFVVVTLALAFVLAAGVFAAQQQSVAVPSAWAYGFATPPGAPAAPAAVPGGGAPRGQAPAPDTTQHQLPGSTASFTAAQIRDGYGPADWYPGHHPAMPDTVAHGSREP